MLTLLIPSILVDYQCIPDIELLHDIRDLTAFEIFKIHELLYDLLDTQLGLGDAAMEYDKRELIYLLQSRNIEPFRSVTPQSLSSMWELWYSKPAKVRAITGLYRLQSKFQGISELSLQTARSVYLSRSNYRQQLHKVLGNQDETRLDSIKGEEVIDRLFTGDGKYSELHPTNLLKK